MKSPWHFIYRILSFMKINNTNLTFSLWHLASALQRLGSGQRSSGDWPFLFRMLRSAPLAAKKQAIDAALFFSAPWVPSPIINWNQMKKVIIFPLGICYQFVPPNIYKSVCECVCVCTCMYAYMNMYVCVLYIKIYVWEELRLYKYGGHLWVAVITSIPPNFLRHIEDWPPLQF